MEANEARECAQQAAISRRRLYRFAYARVAVTVLLALLCAGLLVSVANDVYAFVKADTSVTLTVNAPMPLEELAKTLRQHGIIQNPTVFRWYVESKGLRQQVEAFSGILPLNASMSYREILLVFGES